MPTERNPPPPRSGRAELGAQGETWAAEFFEWRGGKVLDRNWRATLSAHGVRGELDLVVRVGDVVVGVEVKTRSGTGFGHPFDSITVPKLRRLHLLLAAWARAHDLNGVRRRVDAVAVLLERHPLGCDRAEDRVRILHRPGLGH